MLIDYKMFEGFLSIASVETPPVLEKLNLFIKQREPEIMSDIFGKEVYDKFIKDVNVCPEIIISDDPGSIQGVFSVGNALEYTSVIKGDFSISMMDSGIHLRSMPFTDAQDLHDWFANTFIYGSSSAYAYYDCFSKTQAEALGKVYINKDFECFLEDPGAWGFAADDTVSYTDILEKSKIFHAAFAEYGVYSKESITVVNSVFFKDHKFTFLSSEVCSWIKEITACFVWYWYSRDLNSIMANGGTARVKNENAIEVNPAQKQCEVWNYMSDLIFENNSLVKKSCITQLDIFCKRHVRNKYAKINTLNF